MRENELYHYGMPRRSGRYPWGSGGRPYQSQGGKKGFFQKRKDKKAQAAKAREEAKLTPEERTQRREEEKQRALKEGSAQDVLRFKGELTNQELQTAVTRLNLEASLKGLASKEIETNIDKIDKIMKGVKTGTEWVKIGTDTYNSLAKIYNATPEGQKTPLTIIGEGQKKKKNQGD